MNALLRTVDFLIPESNIYVLLLSDVLCVPFLESKSQRWHLNFSQKHDWYGIQRKSA